MFVHFHSTNINIVCLTSHKRKKIIIIISKKLASVPYGILNKQALLLVEYMNGNSYLFSLYLATTNAT